MLLSSSFLPRCAWLALPFASPIPLRAFQLPVSASPYPHHAAVASPCVVYLVPPPTESGKVRLNFVWIEIHLSCVFRRCLRLFSHLNNGKLSLDVAQPRCSTRHCCSSSRCGNSLCRICMYYSRHFPSTPNPSTFVHPRLSHDFFLIQIQSSLLLTSSSPK